MRNGERRKGKRRRTNLVEHKDELLPSSVKRLHLLLDRPAPRPDGVPRIKNLDNDVAHLEDLFQTLGVELERSILDLLLALVGVLVKDHVLHGLRVGGESGGKRGSRGEGRGGTVAGGFAAFELFGFVLYEKRE